MAILEIREWDPYRMPNLRRVTFGAVDIAAGGCDVLLCRMRTLAIEEIAIETSFYFLGAFKQSNWALLDDALQRPGFSALKSFHFLYESPRSPKELIEKVNRVLPALRRRNIEPQVTKLYVRR